MPLENKKARNTTNNCFILKTLSITKLRKKLNQDDTIKIINVRGFGYRLIY